MNRVSVVDVAKYILEELGQMTTMKLQKLVYYSQAWTLVWDEEELFEEDFHAWANGPVCPELFNHHRGSYVIDEHQLIAGDSSLLNSTQIESIDSVLEFYGNKPAHWLSLLTHKESPWLDARADTPDGEFSDNVISKESMLMYYDGLQ